MPPTISSAAASRFASSASRLSGRAERSTISTAAPSSASTACVAMVRAARTNRGRPYRKGNALSRLQAAARHVDGFPKAARLIASRHDTSNSPRAFCIASANSAYWGVGRRLGLRPRPRASHSWQTDGAIPEHRAAVLMKPILRTMATSRSCSSGLSLVGRPRPRRDRPRLSTARLPSIVAGRPSIRPLAGDPGSEGSVDESSLSRVCSRMARTMPFGRPAGFPDCPLTNGRPGPREVAVLVLF
jgi:hypothetical protein